MALARPLDQRGRILDAALVLMAEQGSMGASMRQLASACDLNVATLYHYFPSKADLLRSVVQERRYGERLAQDVPPLDPSLAPRTRLVALLDWLWANALEEQAVWRLLVGEAVRGEVAATEAAQEVVDLLALTLGGLARRGLPRRCRRPRRHRPGDPSTGVRAGRRAPRAGSRHHLRRASARGGARRDRVPLTRRAPTRLAFPAEQARSLRR